MSARTRRKPLFVALARRYVKRSLSRNFDGLYLEGLERVRLFLQTEPLIIAAMHVAYWDALVTVRVEGQLAAESHCLMDAENLGRYPFFGWLGAIPLQRASIKRALVDMRAAASLLDRPGRSLWIFPQGRQRPAHLRPFGAEPGVAWLSRAAHARVVPLAISYVYREAPVPAIFASFGAPLAPGDAAMLRELEGAWDAGLRRIDAFIEHREGRFTEDLPPRALKDHGMPAAGRLLARCSRAPRTRRLGSGEAAP